MSETAPEAKPDGAIAATEKRATYRTLAEAVKALGESEVLSRVNSEAGLQVSATGRLLKLIQSCTDKKCFALRSKLTAAGNKALIPFQALLLPLFPIILFILLFREHLMFDIVSSLQTYILYLIAFLIICMVLSAVYNWRLRLSLSMVGWMQLLLRPIMLGSMVGTILVIVFLAFAASKQVTEIHNILLSTMGLYLACIGVSITSWGVYGQKIPILDLPTLMEYLIVDLGRCKRRFIWLFPGLSFGSVSAGGNFYDKFRNELELVLRNKNKENKDRKIERKVFVLNQEEIYKFYLSYLRRLATDDPIGYKDMKWRIGVGICDSFSLLRLLPNSSKYFVRPELGGYQIIVIDDIIYFLTILGLPIKIYKHAESSQCNQNYESSIGSGNPIIVEAVATRLEDRALGMYLATEIEKAGTSRAFKDNESPPEVMDKLYESVFKETGYRCSAYPGGW